MAPSRLTPTCMLVYLWCFAVFVSSVWGAKVEYEWEVKYMRGAPDCVEKEVLGINGQFPGPTINARAGDTVVVHLTNKLNKEGVVIHWHGIRQLGTPWADGTAAISQCPINIGETFTYEFTVDRAGTYFYHGHFGMQRSAGLYGMLIVDVAEGNKEPFDYDGEFSLLLSDWWHKDIQQQEVDLSASPMRWIGEPQSLLINGRGQYGCTLAPSSPNNDGSGPPTTLAPAPNNDPSGLPQCNFRGRNTGPLPPISAPAPTGGVSTVPISGDESCKPIILDVEPGKTYRLRVASTTALASLNLAIGDHEMEMVEADGNYVDRFSVMDFDIYSGESYSILLHTKNDTSNNYWISVGVRGRKPGTPPALAILRYQSNSELEYPTLVPPTTPQWDDYNHSKSFSNKILAHAQSPKPPKGNPFRQIFLLNTQNLINGYTKWAINNVSLTLPTTPYLGSIKHNLTSVFDQKQPPDTFLNTYDITKPPQNPSATYGNGVYTLEVNKTIDVILQNANALDTGVSEIHPWHLHGHDFWVLGYGEGRFSKEMDEKNLNMENPPFKNTAVIFPHGWTVLRFVADNPGVWAFHCHIEPHLHMGMGVIFSEGVDTLDKEKITPKALACGKSSTFGSNSRSVRVSVSIWIGLLVGIGWLCQLHIH